MTEKKPYSPPQLFRIELDQEQAILSACSLMTTSAADGGENVCHRRRGRRIRPCKNSGANFGDSGPRPS